MLRLIVILPVCFFLFVGVSLRAHSQEVGIPEQIGSQDFFQQLEERFQVKVFYEEAWFDDVPINPEWLGLPLQQAIHQIIRGKGLAALFFAGNVVIYSPETAQERSGVARSEQLVIGNTLEMGRHPRVDIRGRVLDGTTREGIFGAAIYSHRTGTGVTTDENGFFSWRIPAGEHRLRITSMGYEEANYDVLVASEGYAEFQVFERTLELSIHTITARRAEANIASTRMSMLELDAQMLSELPGAMGEQDIIRSFTMLPGIQSMGEFGTGFNVRGGGADQNLLLVEDVPLFNSSHLFGLVSVVNPDMVTNVTLMKAGMPARYGERASSVIDIRKSGSHPDRVSLKGGLGLLYSRAHLETPLLGKRASLSLGVRSSYSNLFLEQMPDIDLMNSKASFYDLSGVLSFPIGQKNTFSIFAYQSQNDFNQAGETDHFYTNRMASFRWNAAFSPSLFSRFTVGTSQYFNRMRELEEFRPRQAFELLNAIDYHTAKWDLSYEGGNGFGLDFGLQGVLYEIDPGQITPMGDESYIKALDLEVETGLELAAYLSSMLELSPKLGIEAGLRLVHFRNMGPSRVYIYDPDQPRFTENITDTVYYDQGETVWQDTGIEPRISLRYLISSNSSVKLSYNRNHQFINLLSNTSVMTPTDVWKLSNQYTPSLVSDQLALGYYHNFMDHTLETSLEVYYRSLHNIPEFRQGASLLLNEAPETDLVRARGYNMGGELYIHKKSGRLTGWISYTLSTSRRKTLEAHSSHQVNRNTWYPSGFDRPHSLTLNANYHISRRWRFNATFTYNTGRPVTYPELIFDYQGHQAIYYSDRNKYRLPDYHRLDLAITFGENLRLDAVGKGSWTVSLVNVYGRKNPYSVFYKKDIPHADNNYRNYSLYKLFIIGRPLPTITYNFSF